MIEGLHDSIGKYCEPFERFIYPDFCKRLVIKGSEGLKNEWRCDYDLYYARNIAHYQDEEFYIYGSLSVSRFFNGDEEVVQAEKTLTRPGVQSKSGASTGYAFRRSCAGADEPGIDSLNSIWKWDRWHYDMNDLHDFGEGTIESMPHMVSDFLMFSLLQQTGNNYDSKYARFLGYTEITSGVGIHRLHGFARLLPGRLQQYYWLDELNRVVFFREGIALYVIKNTFSGRYPLWTGQT